MWIVLFLSFVSVCQASACPKRCTSNVECVNPYNSTLCCVKGLCQSPELLRPGSFCAVGSQDQICAAGGRCGTASLEYPESLGYWDNSLCVNNMCRYSRQELPSDRNCSCTNSSQCISSLCEGGTCLGSGIRVGRPCVLSTQCEYDAVCSEGKCKGLPLGSNCTGYEGCLGEYCTDECDVGMRCHRSTHTCAVFLAEGAACTDKDRCRGDKCYEGVCVTFTSLGQKCGTHWTEGPPRCREPLYCDLTLAEPVCATPYFKLDGHNCLENAECMNKACHNGRCTNSDLLVGKFCNTSDSAACGEANMCNCSTELCQRDERLCYAESMALARAISTSFLGFADIFNPGATMNAYIDVMCCLGCRLGQKAQVVRSVDCTARKLLPHDFCSASPIKFELTACAGWKSSTNTTNSVNGVSVSTGFMLVVLLASM